MTSMLEALLEAAGSQRTPDEIRQDDMEAIAKHENTVRMLNEALPHVQDARAALRVLATIGFDHPKLDPIRQSLAVIADDVQTYLARPAPTPQNKVGPTKYS